MPTLLLYWLLATAALAVLLGAVVVGQLAWLRARPTVHRGLQHAARQEAPGPAVPRSAA